MPSLQRRADGGYYVRHFYRDHNTWQILGAGVRYLERRGITEGAHFSTSLFMEMWLRRLIYHGETIPAGIDQAVLDTALDASVRARVANLHGALFSGRLTEAEHFLFRSEAAAKEQFRQDGAPYEQASWKIEDIVLYHLPTEDQSSFRGAQWFAKVAVRITAKGKVPRDETEFWFNLHSEWYVFWELGR